MTELALLLAAGGAAAYTIWALFGHYWTAYLNHLRCPCQTPLRERITLLTTGRAEWLNDDGTTDTEHLGWKDRWNLAGPQPFNWWWVRRWGGLDCGCTINPITRRRLLTRMGCPTHDDIYNQDDIR